MEHFLPARGERVIVLARLTYPLRRGSNLRLRASVATPPPTYIIVRPGSLKGLLRVLRDSVMCEVNPSKR